MKSKTIILSSQKKFLNNSPRAIVTFIQNNSILEGKIRLYNLSSIPTASKLGVYYENKVYSSNLIKKDDAFTFYINEKFNLDNNLYCAIIDTEKNNDVVLCGGTSNDFSFSIEEDDAEEPNTTEIEENNVTTAQINNKCCDCENCIYKEYFFANKEINTRIEKDQNLTSTCDTNKVENISEIKIEKTYNEEKSVNINSKESEKFLQSITDQLDDMFKTYPEDKTIMQIIPNSKIIKVTDTIDENSYIVGVIYEENEIKYLLYGVPSKYNNPAPKEFGDNYQWLPLNTDDPLSDGYYLLYQDASSGKIVPIIVE